MMTSNAHNRSEQLHGCLMLAECIPSNSTAMQDEAAAAGSIEATIEALRAFPDDIDIQDACIGGMARPILFNRENSLRAGQLGGLNLTLKAYQRWMMLPRITVHGGDIGCFLDYSNENRAILRELGGVELLIQNIRNNFHGQYSDWAYWPVLTSLYGLSSGTWTNEDIAHRQGFVDLSLDLMREHGAESKIAEETLQAARAMMYASDSYRKEYSEKGLAGVLAGVLRMNSHDRGAVSLACVAVRFMVGPTVEAGPSQPPKLLGLDAEAQSRAVREGLLAQLLETAMSRADLRHQEHGFNFDIDNTYDAVADCNQALFSLSAGNQTNTAAMVQAGLPDFLAQRLQLVSVTGRDRSTSCALLGALAASGPEPQAALVMSSVKACRER